MLAREVSPDTYVNIMAQYRPAYKVGQFNTDASIKYADINRRPTLDEILRAYQAAHVAGLWRFDDGDEDFDFDLRSGSWVGRIRAPRHLPTGFGSTRTRNGDAASIQ